MSTTRPTTVAMVSVFEGRDFLGHVIGRGKLGFEAFDQEDKSLGVFPSMRDAANACFLAEPSS